MLQAFLWLSQPILQNLQKPDFPSIIAFKKGLVVDADDLFVPGKAVIGLDQANLLCLEALTEHSLVVSEEVVVDVIEIEHADSH